MLSMAREYKMIKLDKARLIVVCAVVAIAGWALPASALYYVSHWDFSSDALGEFDIAGHNDLVNSNGVAMADGRPAYAAWTVEGAATVTVPSALGLDYGLFDMFGNPLAKPKDGKLALSEEPIYIVSS